MTSTERPCGKATPCTAHVQTQPAGASQSGPASLPSLSLSGGPAAILNLTDPSSRPVRPVNSVGLILVRTLPFLTIHNVSVVLLGWGWGGKDAEETIGSKSVRTVSLGAGEGRSLFCRRRINRHSKGRWQNRTHTHTHTHTEGLSLSPCVCVCVCKADASRWRQAPCWRQQAAAVTAYVRVRTFSFARWPSFYYIELTSSNNLIIFPIYCYIELSLLMAFFPYPSETELGSQTRALRPRPNMVKVRLWLWKYEKNLYESDTVS